MKYRQTVKAERSSYETDQATGQRMFVEQTVEAVVELNLDVAAIGFEMGRKAIQNCTGKSRCMRGDIKARVVSERIIDTRKRPTRPARKDGD